MQIYLTDQTRHHIEQLATAYNLSMSGVIKKLVDAEWDASAEKGGLISLESIQLAEQTQQLQTKP